MVFAKKVTKAPAVMVETKKLSGKDSCCMDMWRCAKMKHCFMAILLIINTILLVCVVSHQMRVEADKVGGSDNYKMVQQIYKSDSFKAQQKQQIEQALQMYQGGWAAQQAAVPTTTTTAPTVTPTVTQ